MPDSSKLSQDYKDFRIRRRYDHFLRFRLLNAKPDEIIKAAKELGFNINSKDLATTKAKQKVRQKAKKLKQTPKQSAPNRDQSAFNRLRGLLKS